MSEIPTPSYDNEVAILRAYYEKAIANVSAELLRLGLTDFERAQIIATQAEIKSILKELDANSSEWVATNIPKAATDGVIRSLVALGLAENVAQAQSIVQFNRFNRDYIKTAVADTQADLLQISQNVDRRVRIAIRQAAAETFRTNLTQGINGTQTLRQDILRRLDDATKTGIVDAASRKWKPQVYAEMVVRTKMSTAHREATMNDALGREVYYAVISSHGAKDACRRWEGQVISLVPDAPGGYPYIGALPRRDIFHPNCKHVLTPVRNPERLTGDEGLDRRNTIDVEQI
ncbi:phage minor capsid protein [Peribacillus huizhouensis]|uniref:Minor capsid protein n=1 Tax=Peribacillus huizhouensis TaxID=1501239 RepID=A0ABR6CR71_9BACI|nr:phage minor capsid protein [Peribacillus huizhouensis]MBA9027529.1 hypothetical protein [Peribacillus huizhouensis]